MASKNIPYDAKSLWKAAKSISLKDSAMSICRAEDDLKNRSVQNMEKISTYLNTMFNKFVAFKLIGGEMSESTFMTHILKHLSNLQDPHKSLTGLLTS